MRRLAFLLLPALCAAQAAPAPQDPFASLRFLEGAWVGEGTGAPGEGAGGFSFDLALDERAMVRHNHADYPATKERPAAHHEDLMVVFPEDGALKADYFDNEGHVIHYGVSTDGDTLRFLSEGAKGPRFRLSYRRTGPDTVAIAFEMAAPGGDFTPYIQAKAKRAR